MQNRNLVLKAREDGLTFGRRQHTSSSSKGASTDAQGCDYLIENHGAAPMPLGWP
jgi:hypothetical protein